MKRLFSYIFSVFLISISIAACNQPSIPASKEPNPNEEFSEFVLVGETKVDFFKDAIKVDLTDKSAVTEYVENNLGLAGKELEQKVIEMQALAQPNEVTAQALPSNCVGTVGVGRAYRSGNYYAATRGTLNCTSSRNRLNVRVRDISGLRTKFVLFGRSATQYTDGVLYSSVAGTTMCGYGDFSLYIGTTLYASSTSQCSYLTTTPN